MILYAPTWRDNQHETGVGFTYSLNLDFGKLRQALGEEYVVVFRGALSGGQHLFFPGL